MILRGGEKLNFQRRFKMTKEECEIETSKAIMEMRKNIAKLEKEKCELLGVIQGKDKVIQELEKENAELKEKLDKIRNYLVYDIFDRFKYLENLIKISQETQEELSKRILEQQKIIGSEIKNWIDRL